LPAAPEGKGSNVIADWDDDRHALMARPRDRARNSDAVLRVQILDGAPQPIVLQMVDKLRIVVETDWDYLLNGPNSEGNEWYAVLPRPDEDGSIGGGGRKGN
jgi:hypothetical protein